MKEFVLIFRTSNNADFKPSPEQIQERMNWLAGIASQNKLVDKGNSLSPLSAKTVRPGNVVTDGPYTEIKEFVAGYVIVRADNLDDATELAKDNPVLKSGGNVEVREIMKRDSNN
ncbi:YciI family protein [Chitinophaga filiformis]|uniref:YciI family protein n=1 Tax=Chitinophaga filiformis TaxID=104663 RepID=A0ABY4I2E3_CHIFI|nr:YciI family protein [Chitinophaga filiformis]UPK69793.1 YciI family protein [Chitinophaga filiformis]